MALPCRKKVIFIIKKKNVKIPRCFYCLSCLHSFVTANKLEYHKKVREKKDFCNVVILSGDSKILEFNQYQKSDKTTSVTFNRKN